MKSFYVVCALGDFLVLSAPVLRQIARYLPHSKDARFCVFTKTHPKSSHDKFKTASERDRGKQKEEPSSEFLAQT